MDYQQMTSPCGLDCFNCPAYLANEDMSLRANISKKRNLSLEKARCAGCIVLGKNNRLVARDSTSAQVAGPQLSADYDALSGRQGASRLACNSRR